MCLHLRDIKEKEIYPTNKSKKRSDKNKQATIYNLSREK